MDSRSGNVDALAHWWALGASDVVVNSGSTYAYSAWLRSTSVDVGLEGSAYDPIVRAGARAWAVPRSPDPDDDWAGRVMCRPFPGYDIHW